MKEDNTVFVLQTAIKTHNLKVTEGSVKEFLLSHPREPLISLVDVLRLVAFFTLVTSVWILYKELL
jgi:hypothetical protein